MVRIGAGVSDAELVGEVSKGDPAAFEVLVRRHLPAAHVLAMSVVQDSDEADDVCQEAFLSALQGICKLREPASFKSWLLSIVRNRALNLLSFEARRAGSALEEVSEESEVAGPEREVEKKELDLAVQEAMEDLSATQKNVFVLHDVEGMNHREVALSLGISQASSRVHLHMARRSLRTRLDRSHLEEV